MGSWRRTDEQAPLSYVLSPKIISHDLWAQDTLPRLCRARPGTSYHLALVELESHSLLASPSLSLFSLSLSGALPCWCRVVVWGFGVGSEGEE